MTDLQPHFADVQAHYDVSNDFYALFLDPSMTYSCGYFASADLTLEQAQRAKIELSLDKCGLEPGMTLLDVGCGWGATMRRAVERYDVNVIGLTLSRDQHDHVTRWCAAHDGPRTAQVRLRGWEQFEEPVDRIVSIGAFEHFGRDRYDAFFRRCHDLLPADGRMLVHTIIGYELDSLQRQGIAVSKEQVRQNLKFARFISREIFPGGYLPEPDVVTAAAADAGFGVERVQSLQPHYARTLDCWAERLRARHDAAVALTSEETYQRYLRYLTGCAAWFHSRYLDVMQFTLVK